MAIIKSFASYQNLSNFGTFINDQVRTSEYFRITEFKDTFTGGKNGFLIEGSEHLKETTEIKIEILDVTGTPIYYEPGNGIPEYYEGISKIVSVHVYEDTPIGLGKITVLGELKTYIDENGVVRDVPAEWSGVYNVKWERTFNVNKNLANETIVRFYQRPKITIDEINKPIFNITTPSVTQTGLVEGIPQQPVYGTDIRNWTAGTLYKLKITDGTNWTSSVDENLIEIPALGYSATVREVLNNKEVFVDVPYLISSSVSNFPATAYTTTFDHIEGQTFETSALTGSFAKIQLSDLKTFVGDVARVKVYRKSRNEVGDYQFIQDTKLESSEILKDITTTATTELSYGQFTQTNIKNYWVSGSTAHPITINVDKLNASIQVDYSGTNYDNTALFITSQSLSLTEGVEYTLSFKTLLSGSNDSTKTLKAYFSGSAYPQQTIVNVTNSAIYTTKQNVTQNVKATKTGDAKLVFEFAGDDWYLANVSLQNAQETSFSPDEFTLIQDIPRKLASETYDFKFEFYDINNNYIPVDVKTSKTFNGGNSFTTTSKMLTFESDRTAFRFSSGSFGNPAFQQIGFKVTKQNLTGSVTYASAAFDSNGSYISSASYHSAGVATGLWPGGFSGSYPGLLTNAGEGGASLTIANFSGSVASVLVGSITYTASCDGLNEFETIYRFEDGDNAPGLFVTANTNQFIYKATDLSLNPTGQIITIEAKRKNLASASIPLTVNSGSGKPPLTLVSTNATNGVDTYTIAGSSYPFSTSETIYSISGSDQFGNIFSDAIKITPIKILDGLSVSLTNENASLPALSTGFVASGSFVLTSGSVSVKVGNETITHSNGLAISNSFDIVSAVATGVNTGSSPSSNYLDYSTTNYWIKQLDADSGSLELRVRYKDGAGDTTDVTKVATYTKNKKAAPVLSFVIGNNNQTTTAYSTGFQVDAFVTASFLVNETYNGVTTSKTFTTSSVTATNLYQIGTATNTTLALLNMATATDSVDISVTGSVVDSENTTRLVFGNISLAKSKVGTPNVIVAVSPAAQSVTANSLGNNPSTPTSLVVTALEGGISRLTGNVSAVGTGVTIGAISGGTIPLSAVTTDNASVAITINYTDSEGTPGTKTLTATISKAKAAAPITLALLSSETQTILSSSAAYATPATFTTTVTEGGSSYTYNAGLSSNSTFYVSATNIVSNTNGTILPNTPTTNAGTTVSLTISYKNSEGATGTITKTHKVGVSLEGVKGTDGSPGSPGLPGNDGKRTATGLLYYQLSAATAPATPTATSYTFSTNTFAGLTANWALGAPTFAAGNSNTYWYSTYTAVETTAGGNTAVPTFTTVTQAIGFTGLVTFTSANKITDGTLESNIVPSGSITNHIGGANVTTIDGGKISTGVITSTGYTLPAGDTEAVGTYTSAGTIFNLNNGSLRSKNFYISSVGSAFFSGSVNAGSGNIGGWAIGATTLTGGNATLSSTGNLTLGTGNDVVRLSADDATYRIWVGHATAASAPFRVTKAGVLTASSATITGEINATSGVFSGNITSTATISGGTITGGSITGNTISGGTITAGAGVIGGWTINQTTLTSNSNSIKLNPSAQTPGLEIYDTNSILRVLVSNKAELTDFTVGNAAVSYSGLNQSNVLNQIMSDDQPEAYSVYLTLPAPLYNLTTPAAAAVTNAGVYNVEVTISQAQLAAASANLIMNYEQFNDIDIEYANIQVTAGVSVRAGSSTGTEVANFGSSFGGIETNQADSYGRNVGVYEYDGSGTTRKFTGTMTATASTTYYFVPYISSAFGVVARGYGSSNVTTFSLYISFNTPKVDSVVLSQDDNRLEMVPGGFQVVASTTRYMKVARTIQDTFVDIGGGLKATGNITAFSSSDKRLKENIIPIGNALNKIEKLDGVEFDWTDEYIQRESNGKGEDDYFFRKHDVGLIAQQVQGILPEVVATREDGYLAIKYEKIVPLLVECIKELKKEINELKENK